MMVLQEWFVNGIQAQQSGLVSWLRLIAVAGVVVVMLGVAKPAWAEEAKHPNVLLIVIDDLKTTIGAYGDKDAITPNLDRLARRGVRFEKAYCNQAVCAPSRINLMTGLRSTTSGIYNLGQTLRDVLPDVVTMPQYFSKYGYHAEAMGKVFHFGHGNTGDPESWSLPPWRESPIGYALKESTGGQLTREEALFQNYKGKVRDLPRGMAWEAGEVADDAYADGRIATKAIERLCEAAKHDEPFFLAVGFTKPHMPFCAPKKYWDMHDPAKFSLPKFLLAPEGAPKYATKNVRGEVGAYEPIPPGNKPLNEELTRKLIHGYYSAATFMDAQLGKVLDELDRLDLTDNTIVVLWGDHGFHLGDHGIWTKHTNYEQANRIPIMIAGPGVAAPGQATQTLAETVDLYPTLIELAGLPPAPSSMKLDGVSLAPALKDPTQTVEDHVYHCFPRGGKRVGRAIRTARYRLVEWKAPGNPEQSADYELYDYEKDPLETKNLADSEPEVFARLKAILAKYPEAKPH